MLLIIFVFCVCGFCAIVRLLCLVCLMLSVSLLVNAFGLFTCNDIAEKMLIVATISHSLYCSFVHSLRISLRQGLCVQKLSDNGPFTINGLKFRLRSMRVCRG